MDEREPHTTPTPADSAANDDATFRKLAMRLIAARYPAPPGESLRLLVGQLPPDLPFDLPLPEGTRVLGSLLQGDAHIANMVLMTDLLPDQVVEFYRERLKAAGWSEEESMGQQRGFVQSGSMSPSLAQFFLGDTGPLLIVTSFSDPDGRSTAEVLLNPGGRGSSFARRRMGAAHDVWSVLPTIRPPAGARQSVEGASGGNDRVISTARLETALDLSTLAVHYHTQLEYGGWERTDAGESGPIAWSAWTFTDEQGEPWRGLFFILKQPDVAERYLLQVSAEWAGTVAPYRVHPGSVSYAPMMGFQSHTYSSNSVTISGPIATDSQAQEKREDQPKKNEAKDS